MQVFQSEIHPFCARCRYLLKATVQPQLWPERRRVLLRYRSAGHDAHGFSSSLPFCCPCMSTALLRSSSVWDYETQSSNSPCQEARTTCLLLTPLRVWKFAFSLTFWQELFTVCSCSRSKHGGAFAVCEWKGCWAARVAANSSPALGWPRRVCWLQLLLWKPSSLPPVGVLWLLRPIPFCAKSWSSCRCPCCC